jgi:outer membrane protein assembly factor BamD (BamD/ComL family)
VAAAATYRAGMAYYRESKRAEYDQGMAGEAVNKFNDFVVLFPDDRRVKEAQRIVGELRTEQARGSFKIAKYYEKKKRWDGALVYYSDVINKDADCPYAAEAKRRIEVLRARKAEATEKAAKK